MKLRSGGERTCGWHGGSQGDYEDNNCVRASVHVGVRLSGRAGADGSVRVSHFLLWARLRPNRSED